jgi:hypothetical protein
MADDRPRVLSRSELQDAKAIAKRVLESGEIYKGEELLAEAVLHLIGLAESLLGVKL